MKNSFLKKIFILSLWIFVFSQAFLFPQSEERFFDTAQVDHQEVRLSVFYPSIGSIKALLALRKNGFIDIEGLLVIGIFHEKELTDYQASIKFINENNLNWFKFHKVTAELGPDYLFQKNSCSQEFEAIFKKSDGIIFFGGADIPPSLYQEKTNLLTQITDPYRHFLELSCIFHILGGFQDEKFKGFLESRPKFPVLGICLGCQSLNVATGGTLIQDIWSEKYGKIYLEDVVNLGRDNWHTNPYARLYPDKMRVEMFIFNPMHPIKLGEKSIFCTAMNFSPSDKPHIFSSHHQAVESLGKGFQIAATSLDGKIVEAIEHQKFPHVLGIQFHPEFPGLWESEAKYKVTPEDKELTSLRTILENNAPSFEFHKKIWSWFSQNLLQNHTQ